MNKIFALLLTAVFAMTGVGSLATSTDEAAIITTPTDLEAEMYEISGTVIELGDGFIVFKDQDGQIVQANMNDETAQMIVLPDGVIALGDYVTVFYDGKMTRSIPAQITALAINSAVCVGQVGEIGEDWFMLATELDEIQVNCTPEKLAGIAAGAQVKVYFSGAMTLSLPAQIGALLIVPVE